MPRFSDKAKSRAKRLGVFFGLAATSYAAQNYVGPQQFALRETAGMVTAKETLPPGVYVHVPFVQYTHSYNSGVQSIAFNAGSGRYWPREPSTSDQNALTAAVTLQYRVTRDVGKLALHRWEMDGWVMPDGYWLLTNLMNDSANAVLGKRTMAQNLSDPKAFARDFHEDLRARLEQNNIPVEIASVELHGFNTTWNSTRTVAYEAVRQQNAPAVK